jgi:cell wall-associated NlpC family hydrolase
LAHRIRRRSRRGTRGGFAASAAAAGLILAVYAHATSGTAPAAPDRAAAAAIAYARAQAGKPYLWGGAGPGAFDCSGLVMMAYRRSGITFGSARPTAAVEWAFGRQVRTPEPGDLVFFAGADGTPAAPGHVGLVVNPARHLMIDAYGAGTVIREETWGLPGSAPGLADPVGYTDPAAPS